MLDFSSQSDLAKSAFISHPLLGV
ncbi:hypothetical protein [Nostoc sp.]